MPPFDVEQKDLKFYFFKDGKQVEFSGIESVKLTNEAKKDIESSGDFVPYAHFPSDEELTATLELDAESSKRLARYIHKMTRKLDRMKKRRNRFLERIRRAEIKGKRYIVLTDRKGVQMCSVIGMKNVYFMRYKHKTLKWMA